MTDQPFNASSQYLDQQQRATTLRVLATMPAITYRGPHTDIVGRLGLAFDVVAGGSTSTVVIDQSTGELLAATERITSGFRPGLFSYVLILGCGHASTADRTQPPGAANR
ncbi:hypothetical protein [Micromonospora sp. WMMD1082]|uniref:hypothetical protein n=1 Tax=Micromonospora sp. WMMD1082 TaxID=3016104 RepID=UPI002416CA51|nr:hypothetical protein [Micromonospora sp. WMMD1082]MDG4795572.1 hypothetical protein [Micromonospora sp. WMMD1082]